MSLLILFATRNSLHFPLEPMLLCLQENPVNLPYTSLLATRNLPFLCTALFSECLTIHSPRPESQLPFWAQRPERPGLVVGGCPSSSFRSSKSQDEPPGSCLTLSTTFPELHIFVLRSFLKSCLSTSTLKALAVAS